MSNLVRLLDEPGPAGLRDLGGRWDLAILEECRVFATLDERLQESVRDAMTRDRSWAIVSWAEGMASLGVRHRDRKELVLGLVGLSLFDHREFDERDAAVVYPLFVRAAELIDVDADETTGEGAERTDGVGRSWLLSLLPASRHEVGAAHDETGSGADFAFRRREVDWDPQKELADFAED